MSSSICGLGKNFITRDCRICNLSARKHPIGGLFDPARNFQKRSTMEFGVKTAERIDEALREIAVLFIALMIFLVALFAERKRSSG